MDLPGITEVADARSASWRDGDAWLAGGTWLFSRPQPGLSRLLNLAEFGWPAVRADRDGLEIAATCTLAELARLRLPQWSAGSLIGQCCAALPGSFTVGTTATVGGNLCLARPDGPMIALTCALDGICTIWGPDGAARPVDAADFVTGAGRNVLMPGELLRSVRLPAAALAARTSFRRISLTPAGPSGALVIGRRSPADGSVVITLAAATAAPVRLRFTGLPSPDELQAALVGAGPTYHDDVQGSAAWREAAGRRLSREVLAELGGLAEPGTPAGPGAP